MVAWFPRWVSKSRAQPTALIPSLPSPRNLDLTMHPSCLVSKRWFSANLATITWDALPVLCASSRALNKSLSILAFLRANSMLTDSNLMVLLRAFHHLLLIMAPVNTLKTNRLTRLHNLRVTCWVSSTRIPVHIIFLSLIYRSHICNHCNRPEDENMNI